MKNKKIKKYYLGGAPLSQDTVNSVVDSYNEDLMNKNRAQRHELLKDTNVGGFREYITQQRRLDAENAAGKPNVNFNEQLGIASDILKGTNFAVGTFADIFNDASNTEKERKKYISTLQTVKDPSFVQNDLPVYTKFGGGGFPRDVAFKILRDKKVGGKPLTDKQRKFFATMAFAKKKAMYGEDTSDDLEMMQNGGIPERYKSMGFSKVDTPKRTPSAAKSHAVVIKDGDAYKLIRFGQQGVSGSPKKEGESESYKARRESFKARHSKNIAKGKTSAAYWANKVKWQDGGQVPEVDGLPENRKYMATIEAEAGEVYKQPDGQVLKISEDGDRHEEGGEMIANVEKVLEDTSTSRKDKKSKSLIVTPEAMEDMFGVVVNKNLSHSEALEAATKELNKKTSKIEGKLKKVLDSLKDMPTSKYANNSLEMNIQELQKYPTKENLFDTLFEHQESIKEQQDMKQAKYGIELPKAETGLDDITIKSPDKTGGRTPSGENNNNFNFTQEDINRYAKRLGLRNDTNKNFQEDLYNYATKNNPEVIDQMWKLYGNTTQGINTKTSNSVSAFADGNPKARTMFVLGNILKTSPKEDLISFSPKTGYSPGIRDAAPKSKADLTMGNISKDSSATYNIDNKDMFNEPLNATDLLAPALSFLSADRIPANYNPASYKKIDPRLENVLPYLQQGQRDFNALTSKIDSNSGSEVGNAVNTFAQKYAIDTNTMATVADRNLQRQSSADIYNAQVSDKQSESDQRSRATFEQQQLLGMEAQRKQKLTALDEIFQRVNLNRKLNKEGDLLMKLFPNFNSQGNYNGIKRNFSGLPTIMGAAGKNSPENRYVGYTATDGAGRQVPMVFDTVTGRPMNVSQNQNNVRQQAPRYSSPR